MLTSLLLNNVALIKKQSIDFGSGFNCILGQSGAGKSIVIDALSFLLGAKSDKNLIRSGEAQLRVDGVFSDLSSEVVSFLSELEIDVDDEIIITRTLTAEGKSSVKINGYPATAKTLKDLAELLADFCGQHDSVGLLNINNHLSLLDKFGGEEVEKIKAEVSSLCEEFRLIEKKISDLGGNESDRERTKDILNFQINEIENANLQLCEDEEIKERLQFIQASESIYDKVGEVLLKLDEQGDNASSLLYEAKSLLSSVSEFKDIEECRERVENCYYEIKDVVETLESVKQNTEFDPKELEMFDARLDLIKSLTKKYGGSIENVLDHLDKSKKQLDEIENSQFLLEKLEREKQVAYSNFVSSCEKLSVIRKKYAKDLEQKLVCQLEDLEMKGARFDIDFSQTNPSKNGFDLVKFRFSANKGQDLKDLNKTASGGELSRLLLALKNVMLGQEKVQTVVFDEIDSGISGHTAGRLAEKLANISKFTQVICITHTPVVASKADNFLLVEKKIVENNTISVVSSLNDDQKVVEIARLIDGGIEVSQTAIEHAKKLIEENNA